MDGLEKGHLTSIFPPSRGILTENINIRISQKYLSKYMYNSALIQLSRENIRRKVLAQKQGPPS